MKKTILIVLLALSICAKFHQFEKDFKHTKKNYFKKHHFPHHKEIKAEITIKQCEECEKEGFCPLECKKYFIKKMEKICDECEQNGSCPMTCKKYFVKKMTKKCLKCEKKASVLLNAKNI